jgi:hypothetical protein
MPYTLNGVDLTTYGLFPSRADNSNIAIAGCWDFPERIGKASYDWGDDNGIEPYLQPGQIFFAGRTITITVALLARDRSDAKTKITNLYKAIDFFSNLVTLSCSFGTFQVYVNDAIKVTYVKNGKAYVKLSFREPVASLNGIGNYFGTEIGIQMGTEDGGIIVTEDSTTNFVNTNSPTGIDGISFLDLGISPLSFENALSRPGIKTMNFKSYENEGYQIVKRKERTSVLRCLVAKNSYSSFVNAIVGLYGLFTQPNEHTLNYPSDSPRPFFVRDGFTVTNVNIRSNLVTALVNINITETGKYGPLVLLTDSGDQIITDDSFNLSAGDYFQTEF